MIHDLLLRLDRLAAGIAAGPAWRARAVLVAVALALLLPAFATLPVTDRDEGRYIQASKQMAQTGDVIDIRFQDDPRHKKPVGIYWLQAATVTAAGGPDTAPEWLYRLPSLAGAVLAVLLTRAAAVPLIGAAGAFWAALLMAACMVLTGEARIAKVDAALLAATLGAMAVLARLWALRAGLRQAPLPGWQIYAFWVAIAAGVLLKGPITPLVVGLTVLALAAVARSGGWLRPLARPGPVAVAVVMVVPWLVAITLVSEGAFWTASVGEDLLAKAAEGDGSKGAPPGTYLLGLWVAFWPGSMVLALGVPLIWAMRRAPAAVFALAWALPTWLLFELVPTKLPHYVLPTFPALAMLAVMAWWARPAGPPGRAARWLGVALAAIGAVLLAVIAAIAGAERPAAAVPALLALPVALGLVWAVAQALAADRRAAALALLVPLAFVTYAGVLHSFARHAPVWPSVGVVEVLDTARGDGRLCPAPRLVTAGFHEPSLVVLTSRDLLQGTADQAAATLAEAAPGCAAAIVAAPERAAFDSAAGALGLATTSLGRVTGIALGTGRTVDIAILTTAR